MEPLRRQPKRNGKSRLSIASSVDKDLTPKRVRRRQSLIESSASEGSLSSSSVDDSGEFSGQLRNAARDRARRKAGQSRSAHFVKYGDQRSRGNDEDTSESMSSLEDFLADSNETISNETTSNETTSNETTSNETTSGKRQDGVVGEAFPVAESVDVRKYGDDTALVENCRAKGRKKRVVESSSSSDAGMECLRAKKLQKSKDNAAEDNEEEEEFLTPSSKEKRALRVRKTLRDQHGGQSPMERIRRAQKRALQNEESSEDVSDSISGASSPQDATEMCHTRECSSSGTATASTASTASTTSMASSVSSDSSQSSESSSSSDSSSESSIDSEERQRQLKRRRNQQRARELMLLEAGSFSQMTEDEAFKVYIELMFILSIDPSYQKQVESSPAHKVQYDAARNRIEYLLISAQDQVHSEVWRGCDWYLLESMEQFSRFEIRRHKSSSRNAHLRKSKARATEDDITCSACNRWGGHKNDKMIRITFIGRQHKKSILSPGESELGKNMHLSHNYLLASPIYQQRRGLWTQKDPSCEAIDVKVEEKISQELKNGELNRSFYLGWVCCRRITTFHALLHFRRHCILYLTRRAKGVLKSRRNISMNQLLDEVLSDEATSLMYACFQSMLEVARTFQLIKGNEAQYAVSSHGAFRAKAPQEILIGDQDTDVSSLEWEEKNEKSATDEESGSTDHEGEDDGDSGSC
jgi:hypothetical protein